MMVKSHFKIADGIDVSKLKRELLRQPALWGINKQRLVDTSPHKDTTDIWVRFNKDIPEYGTGDWARTGDEHDSQWYPSYYFLPAVKDIIFKVMSLVEGERLGTVLITKTPPGAKVHPHTDMGWHAEYYDKYYIPIQNKDGAVFGFPDGNIEPKEGDVWWFDNSITHWVDNNSNEDRLSLIVCIRSDSTKNSIRSNLNANI